MSAFGDDLFREKDPESWARSHLKELESVITRAFDESRELRAELARTRESAKKTQADLTTQLRALHAEANRKLETLHSQAVAELKRIGAEKARLSEELRAARAKFEAIEAALSEKCAENERLRHANQAMKRDQDSRIKEFLDLQHEDRSELESRIALLEADKAALEARVRAFSRSSPSGAYAYERGQARESSYDPDPMIFVDGPLFPERRR